MDGAARIRQPQREQKNPGTDVAQIDPQIGEVDLGFRPRWVQLRHEPARSAGS